MSRSPKCVPLMICHNHNITLSHKGFLTVPLRRIWTKTFSILAIHTDFGTIYLYFLTPCRISELGFVKSGAQETTTGGIVPGGADFFIQSVKKNFLLFPFMSFWCSPSRSTLAVTSL